MSGNRNSPKNINSIKVVAAPVRQQVADAIRRAIVNLEFLPGERLVERELCEMTGVSRTSLREGLRELEAEGLVKNMPYKGLIVATVTLPEARNIYDVRCQLEGLLGRESAKRRTDGDLADLRANFERVTEAVNARRFEDLIGLKGEFYLILMRITDNPVLTDILTNLQGRVAQFRATVMTREDRVHPSLNEIRTIIESIEAGDAFAAEAACIEHVRNASLKLFEILGEMEGAG